VTVALLTCAALVGEVREIASARGWDARVYALPSHHHLRPERLPDAVDAELGRLRDRHDRVVVVYGDCGTGGALDRVLERRGSERPSGPHCYEQLAGRDYERLVAEQPGTYFLTPWLVRNWERAVVRGLGLDRHPELRDDYFARFTRVVYLRRHRGLEERAAAIATSLALPLEVLDVGLGALERRLADIVETTGGG
jgi:hypothetical protein